MYLPIYLLRSLGSPYSRSYLPYLPAVLPQLIKEIENFGWSYIIDIKPTLTSTSSRNRASSQSSAVGRAAAAREAGGEEGRVRQGEGGGGGGEGGGGGGGGAAGLTITLSIHDQAYRLHDLEVDLSPSHPHAPPLQCRAQLPAPFEVWQVAR